MIDLFQNGPKVNNIFKLLLGRICCQELSKSPNLVTIVGVIIPTYVVKYFKNKTSASNSRFQIEFKDTVDVVNGRLSGWICKNVSFNSEAGLPNGLGGKWPKWYLRRVLFSNP